ncbi:hypothetical protein GCM10027447_01780 [Glycomyces halotolerans]
MTASPRRFVQRHVLPANVTPPLDDHGFLHPNRQRPWYTKTAPTPMELDALAERPDSFVLLSPDGSGKSTALHHLQEDEPGSRWIDLNRFDLGGLRTELDQFVTPGATLYVDGVDIGLFYEPRLAALLADRLQDPGLSDVRWRFGCRPASWSSQLELALDAHLASAANGNGRQDPCPAFVLLPLTRDAAQGLAASVTEEPERFIEALVTARLGRLAGHPGRLTAVATRWRVEQSLPATHAEALKFEVEHLLFDANTELQSKALNEERKAVIAARLGAFTMFCSADRYSSDDFADSNVATISTLPFAAEPAEPGIEYPPDHYRVVLGSALFDRDRDGAIGFAHQQYAEFLAARYLVERRTPSAKIRMLLGVQRDGTLPRAMTATAAWIAALQPDLTHSIIVDNATAFLESQVDLPSDELRRDIVDRILTAAGNDDIDVLYGESFANLAHSALEPQLLRYLDDKSITAMQLWWIANLAENGAASGACAKLEPHVYSSACSVLARRACARTIGAIGTPEQRMALAELLRLPEAEDPNDDLLAMAIDALYPELLSTEDLLAVLRPRRNRNYLGPYQVLLGSLPQRIPPADLGKTLNWVSIHAAGDEWGFGQLVPKLVAIAWSSPQRSDLIPEIAKVVAAGADRQHWGGRPLGAEPPWVKDSDPQCRRELLLTALEVIDDDDSYRLDQLGLFTADDPLWAVAILPDLEEPVRSRLARWVAHSDQDPPLALIEAVLSLPDDHPAHAPTAFWRDDVPIDCHIAQAHQKRLARDAEAAARKAEYLAQRKTSVLDAVATATRDPDRWWQIPFRLLGTSQDSDWLRFDITEHEGWADLDTAAQEQILEIGCNYLETHDLNPAAWQGAASISPNLVLPDWSGVFLLATLACHWPDRLARLDPTAWARWAPAIIGSWDPDPAEQNPIRRDLMNRVPDCAHGAFTEALWAHLAAFEAAERPLAKNVSLEWATTLAANELGSRLVAGAYSNQLGLDLLDLLSKQNPTQAIDTCWRLLDEPDSHLRLRAARNLASLAPIDMLVHLATGVWANQELYAFIPYIDPRALEPDELALLSRFLLDRFPIANDPPWEGGWVGEANAHDTLRARARCLEQLANLGLIEILLHLNHDRNPVEANYLKLLVRRARVSNADLAVKPLKPSDLLQLLDQADARIMRSAEDLQSALLHQLDTIQHELRTTGLYRDIWNQFKNYATPKNEDSISDWLQRQLRLRFKRPIFIDREVQVRRPSEHGIGTRIDLTASTTSYTRHREAIRVIAEAKLVNNNEVNSAMQEQLYEKYLDPLQLSHGLYLVFWVRPDQRPNEWSRAAHPDPDALLQQLQVQAERITGSEIIPYILDISMPAT